MCVWLMNQRNISRHDWNIWKRCNKKLWEAKEELDRKVLATATIVLGELLSHLGISNEE